MKNKKILSLVVFLLLCGVGLTYRLVNASDHDDGETDTKSRSLNLTDHYVFRKGDQTGVVSDDDTLVFVQNSNPRSLPDQQYFFSSNAHYEIHVSRVTTKSAPPTGSEDVMFQFSFGPPDDTNTQSVTLAVYNGGTQLGYATGATTPLTTSKAGSITPNQVTVAGQSYLFFAGLRQDPFFFDVERFFQVRYWLIDLFVNQNASAAGNLPVDCTGNGLTNVTLHLFNPNTCAPDFTHNYNANSIVLEAPIAALQSKSETTFDTWSIITTPH